MTGPATVPLAATGRIVVGASGAPRTAPARRDNNRALTPTPTFRVAATRNDPRIPISPIKKNPAPRAPAIAPAVLIPYRRLTRVPMLSTATAEDRNTSGS